MTHELLERFSNNNYISHFKKIRPVGAEFFHADRRTDMTKLMVTFRKFTNAPKNLSADQIQYSTD